MTPENEKKVFSQTYILYDKAGVVKPTFVSELEQYVNIFSQFTIFCEKSNKYPKKFMKNNNKSFFRLKNNYTGEKEFSRALRKLDESPAKFFSKTISIEFSLKYRQNGRKKMYDKLSFMVTFMVLGIQDLTQLITLNPVFIDISNSPP